MKTQIAEKVILVKKMTAQIKRQAEIYVHDENETEFVLKRLRRAEDEV